LPSFPLSTTGEPLDAAIPYRPTTGGLRLAVRLTPHAAAERILGLARDHEGAVALKVAVTAPPEAGKANDALLRLLAKTFRLPRTAFSIALGAGDRRKLVDIAGDPAKLMHHLEEVLRPWLRAG
jgi:uncharacterized protein (TIGR00251 family)